MSDGAKKRGPKIAKAAGKRRDRATVRAGLCFEVGKARRKQRLRWRGGVSEEAAVALAAWQQYIAEKLLQSAWEATGDLKTRIAQQDVQSGIEANPWMRNFVPGQVMGVKEERRDHVLLSASGE